VYKCFDHKEKVHVAMKILLNKKRLFKQGLLEKKILEVLMDDDPEDNKNVVRIQGSIIFRGHLILMFELLSINLYDFLKLNSFKGVSLGLVRRFAIQLLVALHHMREHSVVHCDLKPENILLCHPNKSGIKIIDFGSGTF
jgi:dual specificity tyrosine-phosphorylation-regulated kinase 2/3/4